MQNKPFGFWRMRLNGTPCANVRIYIHAIWCGKAWPKTTCAASREPERSACGTLAWSARTRSAQSSAHSLPPVKLNHLSRMTDDTGMLQHAVFAVPNHHEGYTTDDNARALIVSILVEQLGADGGAEAKQLASRYLAFLWLAFNSGNGRFRNFLSYERQWQEAQGSEDSHGRALWSLGTAVNQTVDEGLRGLAGRLFELAVPAAWLLPALGPGRSPCLEFRNTLIAFQETGPHKDREIYSPTSCWRSIKSPGRRVGTGLKIAWPIPTLVCPRHYCWQARAPRMKSCSRPASSRWSGWRRNNAAP